MIPASLRNYLADGGSLFDLDDEAIDRITECVIVDRVIYGFDDWNRRQLDVWGPIEREPEPERTYRRWEAELANDAAFADRVELLLPADRIATAFTAVLAEHQGITGSGTIDA